MLGRSGWGTLRSSEDWNEGGVKNLSRKKYRGVGLKHRRSAKSLSLGRNTGGWGLICSVNAALRESGLIFPWWARGKSSTYHGQWNPGEGENMISIFHWGISPPRSSSWENCDANESLVKEGKTKGEMGRWNNIGSLLNHLCCSSSCRSNFVTIIIWTPVKFCQLHCFTIPAPCLLQSLTFCPQRDHSYSHFSLLGIHASNIPEFSVLNYNDDKNLEALRGCIGFLVKTLDLGQRVFWIIL